MGDPGAGRGPRRGAGRPPTLRARRLPRPVHEQLGTAHGRGRRHHPALGDERPRPLDGPRPGGGTPRARRGRARRERPAGGGVLAQRRRRPPGGRGDDPAAQPGVRGRAARPDPARDALACAAVADRRDRVARRHGASRVALVPALPPRVVRCVRPALGRPRRGRLRPRRPPLRGGRCRGAARQLHPARPRRRDGRLPARLLRPAARRVSQPRVLHERRLALRARRRRRAVRRDGALLARRGRPDHRRLLRRGTRPHRRGG